MSKSVLILNTPISCGTCKFHIYSKGVLPCCNAGREHIEISTWPSKPQWCPLKELEDEKIIYEDDYETILELIVKE